MARVKGVPTAGSGSAQTKTPELPLGFMCRHSSSSTKFSYIRAVRRMPVGTPVVTIIPSLTKNVPGALLTFTQPARSLPLNRGTYPSSFPTGFSSASARGRSRAGSRNRESRVFMVVPSFRQPVQHVPGDPDDRRVVAAQPVRPVGRADGHDRPAARVQPQDGLAGPALRPALVPLAVVGVPAGRRRRQDREA